METWQAGGQSLSQDPDYPAFYQDYWRFSQELFRNIVLAEDYQDNVIYCPLSAYLPLSEMAYALAEDSLAG